MVDFRAEEEVETRVVFERLLAWTEPARGSLGIEVELPRRNGSERARAAFADGASLEDIYRSVVAETAATYGRVGEAADRL